ncbi:TPA: type I glyceraldehyde-3-phosphate dehydrogenase [Candidatus Bathyarchaeota archaeon]|nr:type I glyceraldehyde-3-phosphate dehydrogenase [Candidatus Bathyarchaeota archaeon]
MVKVAINGFGRTGRLALRAALEKGSELEFVAVNRGDAKLLGHLLKYDSVHGRAPFPVEVEGDTIVAAGKRIKVLNESDAEKLPWKDMGVYLVIDASDKYRDRDGAGKHIKAGASKVLVGAPGKKLDATIVLGVNDKVYDPAKHHLVSNASCTTNCTAPVVKVLNDSFGIEFAMVSTIHAYTGTQMILDRADKDLRRARAAALSIIPTSTGMTSAIGEVLPELKGKIDGTAFRVPTPDVSLIDVSAVLKGKPTADQINAAFKEAAAGKMKGILGYSDEPLVSVDYVHSTYSSVVDGASTISNGAMVKVVAWYDNEFGYSCRTIELAEKMAGLK